jgi:hypothetical protein
MPRCTLAFSLLALLTLTAGAQEAITIKIAAPKPGDRSKVTIEDKTVTRTAFKVGEKVETKDEVKTKSLVYIDDIIENPMSAKRATKLKRTFEKAVVAKDGKKLNLPVEAKTVLIEKKGDKYFFSIDGKAVTGDALRILEDEFNRAGTGEVRDIMFPKKPVQPGEPWKVDAKELVKALGEQGPTFAEGGISADGRLVKAYKKGGKQFGVIEFNFAAPLTSLGPKNPVTVKDGKMTMKLSGEGCIDGTVATGKSNSRLSLELTGSTMGIDLKVGVENTENRTVEALPKN